MRLREGKLIGTGERCLAPLPTGELDLQGVSHLSLNSFGCLVSEERPESARNAVAITAIWSKSEQGVTKPE
jgi:hypothetical protein